jgi:hypothetical protein
MGKSNNLPERQPFSPDATFAAQLAANRAGKFTRAQRNTILIGAVGSSAGLLCILGLAVSVLQAWVSGISMGGLVNVVGVIFFIFFVLSFGYLGLTLYFNASWFVPDALSQEPVKQSRGKLQIRKASRERPELPFSYIVGDYSFAPYDVPMDVPMEAGREYVVYYAAHSRIFLNIEPADYADSQPT